MAGDPGQFRKDLPIVDEKGRPERHFSAAFDQTAGQAAAAVTGSGAAGEIAYWDAGSDLKGDAHLTWDKTKQTLTATAPSGGSESAINAKSANGGIISLQPTDPGNAQLLMMQAATGGNTIPTATSAVFMEAFETGAGFLVEVEADLTPGVANPFSNGVGVELTGKGGSADQGSLVIYEYGLETGAIPGTSFIAQRNADGSGAAGTLGGEQRSGARWYIWQDATGAMRYGPARPTEDNSVSDTSGSLFGAGLSAAQVAARVAVGV